jgi:hypothetical protein
MPILRRTMALLLPAVLACTVAVGCGGPSDPDESSWRREVDASLASLQGSEAFRYRIHLETWVGVSGQSVYGDEKGDGSYADGDFSVSITRTSPAGEESLAIAYLQDGLLLQEDGAWRSIAVEEAPSPLYDPQHFVGLVSAYGSVSLEGEEEISGRRTRRYLLQLGGDRARDALSGYAWSYFSPMAYELNCRIWVTDAAAPPSSLQLEVVGFDSRERLQRYRLLATMEPFDIDTAGIQPITPPAVPE